jgi:hypothetical protein
MNYLLALTVIRMILEEAILPVAEKTDNKIDDAIVKGFLSALKSWLE